MESLEGLLALIQQSSLGRAARGSAWLYPFANVTHVLGLATLFGALGLMHAGTWTSGGTDQRAWRVARGIAIAAIVVLALSGVVMFSTEAQSIGRNPVFIAKIGLIALALANIALFEWLARRPRYYRHGLRAVAIASLALWLAVATAGRLIAYW